MPQNIVFVVVICFLLFLICCGLFYVRPIKEALDEGKPDILLIVSRYNENLEWLKDEPFRHYPVIIYNKGNNDDFYKPENTQVVSIKNVGREGHTYIYHIIQHYDNLNEILVFLPGSNNLDHKLEKSKRMIHEIEKKHSAVFISSHFNDVRSNLYDFQLDKWVATHSGNASVTPTHSLELAPIRPFGKWYEDKFGDVKVQHVAFGGVFSVSKQDVLNKPKSFYEKLIRELDSHSNPEVGHYFERSWEAIFYPMNHTQFIEGFSSYY